jgi:hypothetical protein
MTVVGMTGARGNGASTTPKLTAVSAQAIRD